MAKYARPRAAVALAASLALLWPAGQAVASTGDAVPPPVHAATGPSPAFYTSQAPGVSPAPNSRVVALTFDDGPGPYTPQVLSILQRYGVPATFFEVGIHVLQYPQYTRMLAAAGDPVEDHSWDHPDLTTIPVSEFPQQIDQTQSAISSITGITPSCVRPPYNDWNATVLQQIANRGLTTMSYSVDPRDWALPGTGAIESAVVSHAFPGAVILLHDGGGPRDETVAALPSIITDLRADGYSFVSICGRTGYRTSEYGFGQAPVSGPALKITAPLVGSAAAPFTQGGYWMAAADGSVLAFDAPRFGSLAGHHLNKPIVAMAAAPNGRGYYLMASDGGVFPFGDAPFYGSLGNIHLNKPIVAAGVTTDGKGYYLMASDGGVFEFGDANFYGSLGSIRLNKPIVGAAVTRHGYWLVASDGGLFQFGAARFFGSLGSVHLNRPIVAMATDPSTGGYWMLGSDGGLFQFHAPYYGSRGGAGGSTSYVAVDPVFGAQGYVLVGQQPF